MVDYIVFKKLTKWFKNLSPRPEPYKIIDNETKQSIAWLGTIESIDTNENFSKDSNNLKNGKLNNVNEKTPPESGIWISQTSSISHTEVAVHLIPQVKSSESPMIIFSPEDNSKKSVTSSPTTISSPSESYNGSDLNISSQL